MGVTERRLSRDDSPELGRQLSFRSTGRKYVDFVTGRCVVNFGWNNRAVKHFWIMPTGHN
jgi:hypothetical protein